MSKLSEQIRELVSKSPTSSYAIARAAGIEKSAMSRFMNGGTLTMSKLDRLAEVLGVVVVSNVSQVPRQLTKGRPKKKDSEKMIAQEINYFYSEEDAILFARDHVEDAFKNHFQSRRGVWALGKGTEEEPAYLFYYNNIPSGGTLAKLRAPETRRIVKRLKAVGINVLGRAQAGYKLEGCNELSTIGLILGCSPERQSEVAQIINDEVILTSRALEETK